MVIGGLPLSRSVRAAPIAWDCGWTEVSLSAVYVIAFTLPLAWFRADVSRSSFRSHGASVTCRLPGSSQGTAQLNVLGLLDIQFSKIRAFELFAQTIEDFYSSTYSWKQGYVNIFAIALAVRTYSECSAKFSVLRCLTHLGVSKAALPDSWSDKCS